MINRKPKLRPGDRTVVIIDQSEEGTTCSKGSKDKKGRSRKVCSEVSLSVILLLVCCFAATFTLYRILPSAELNRSSAGSRSSTGSRPSPAKVDGPRDEIKYLSSGEVRMEKEIKFPDGWEEYSYEDIRHHFNCRARSNDDSKPLPTMEDWLLMRRTFTEVVDNKRRWDDPVPPTLGYSLEPGVPAPPPYFPKASPGKGRGLFASRDIKKGELVHDGTHSDVIFPDAVAWRRFVFSLGRDLACDCTDWHWMQKLERGGRYFMLGGMNISSLMNSGGKEFGPGKTPNALPESIYSGRFYATRDIEKFEEILTDYDSYYTNWAEVGL